MDTINTKYNGRHLPVFYRYGENARNPVRHSFQAQIKEK